MSAKNLYIGNLPFSTTKQDLANAFGAFGKVDKTEIVVDRDTGRSRGFGFVEMAFGGAEAVVAMNGALFQGRALRVNEAKEAGKPAAKSKATGW